MKKIFALILTLALIFSLAAVPAYADTIDSATGSATQEVKATYDSTVGSSDTIVYSVTIVWGAMNFTYHDSTWNPTTHSYDASWTHNGNTVKVINDSNTGITAKLSYIAKDGFTGITGTFDSDTLELDTAVGTAVNASPNKTATLTLSGALNKNTAAATAVGTITVTIQAAE